MRTAVGRERAGAALLLSALMVFGCSAPLALRDAHEVTPSLPQAGGAGERPAEAVGAAEPDPAPAPSAPPRAARAAPEARAAAPARAFPYAVESEWIPTTLNHDRGRGGAPVRYIVIHYTAISYQRTLRAFYSPHSRVSAHYVVRGDGHVAQIVGEADTAWHAGDYWFNQRSVGIEIELDPVTNPQYTPEQYYATAALACAIAARQGIPRDRAHVIGHNEIPGTGKIDPGPSWGWPHFMWLTSLCAPPTAQTVHAAWVAQTEFRDVRVGESAEATITLRNTGATAWRKGTSQEARLGVRGNDVSLAPLVGASWPAPDRPAVQNEEIVPPGGLATFTVPVRAAVPGTYTIPLRGVIDGGAWMDDMGIYTTVKVRAPKVHTSSKAVD